MKQFLNEVKRMQRLAGIIQEATEEESYTVAGRPVTLIKGDNPDGTDWKVKFKNSGAVVQLSDVLALIKPKSFLNSIIKYSAQRSKEGGNQN